jgi:C4-dicarboxylate-specific signal transduction histidine kinase
VLELLSRPDFGVVRAALDRMRHEEERNVTQEYAVRGRTYLCSITAVRADETVQGEGEVILIKDITDLKEIENQLLQSSKMSAVGQLAAGVAHEFNNLMASVYGYAQFMKQHPENAAVVQKGVEVILRSSERARELPTSRLTFCGRRPGRREPVDVNQILTDTLLLLHRQMEKSGVRVERNAERIPLTVADPGKLQEVLNMLVNAQQAMPERHLAPAARGGQHRTVSSD